MVSIDVLKVMKGLIAMFETFHMCWSHSFKKEELFESVVEGCKEKYMLQ